MFNKNRKREEEFVRIVYKPNKKKSSFSKKAAFYFAAFLAFALMITGSMINRVIGLFILFLMFTPDSLKEKVDAIIPSKKIMNTIIAVLFLVAFYYYPTNNNINTNKSLTKSNIEEKTAVEQANIQEKSKVEDEIIEKEEVEELVAPTIELELIDKKFNYEDKTIDAMDLIKVRINNEYINKDEINEIVSCDTENIDLNKIGEFELNYNVVFKQNEKEYEKEFSKTITVEDVEKPTLELEKSEVQLNVGDSFDPKTNLKSITDNYDSDFVFVNYDDFNNTNDKACYAIDSQISTAVAGAYTVNVLYKDSNGNEGKRVYSVKVNEPVKQEATTTTRNVEPSQHSESEPVYDYVFNRNTKVYHYSYCGSVSRMKEENKMYFS